MNMEHVIVDELLGELNLSEMDSWLNDAGVGMSFYELVKKMQVHPSTRRSLILTPHPMELSRICKCSREDLSEKGLEIAENLAKELQCAVVKKDARTIICDETSPHIMNLRGNSGMGTAGSGDVLTGIIAAMLALKLSPKKAAALGVYIHALSGDYAAMQKNEYSMLASDICNALINVLKCDYSESGSE